MEVDIGKGVGQKLELFLKLPGVRGKRLLLVDSLRLPLFFFFFFDFLSELESEEEDDDELTDESEDDDEDADGSSGSL